MLRITRYIVRKINGRKEVIIDNQRHKSIPVTIRRDPHKLASRFFNLDFTSVA